MGRLERFEVSDFQCWVCGGVRPIKVQNHVPSVSSFSSSWSVVEVVVAVIVVENSDVLILRAS